MVPKSITRQLRNLRGRELVLHLVWGFARWLAFALGVLALACLIDWAWDGYEETPFGLRVALVAAQVVLYLAAAWWFVLRPLARFPSLDRLAERVEACVPGYRHRLVTALQLNRPGAKLHGVSPELLAVVTREADAITRAERFTRFADHRRLRWSAWVGGPALLAALAALLLAPETVSALLARQTLRDAEIPRSVVLENRTPRLWPSGEGVTLRYAVTDRTGAVRPGLVGAVRIEQEGQPAQRLPLTFEEQTGPDTAVFAARVPPASEPFRFRAWLADGRTRGASEVEFVPRPVVTRVEAWVRLPEYVGRRPDGGRYEVPQAQGEILARPDSAARVRIDTQKPIARASLVLMGRAAGAATETVLKRLPMRTEPGGRAAEVVFDLAPGQSGYRVEVEDEHGFGNAAPPRRGIALGADEPPYVKLLPEHFPGPGGELTDEAEVDGMPLPRGGSVRIAYYARSPLGLARARLAYRVNDGPWEYLPLAPVKAGPDVGRFDTRRGAFENSGFRDEVEFYAIPSSSPDTVPDGLEGGGRFDFRTAALRKTLPDGSRTELQLKDQVEFVVEVFDRKDDPDDPGDREPGRSAARLKTVVDIREFYDWMAQTLENERRIRQLQERQQRVFGGGEE
ncbi:MAG TPA: hypothetical protein VIL46_03255 [Gemmataceae bacterium]